MPSGLHWVYPSCTKGSEVRHRGTWEGEEGLKTLGEKTKLVTTIGPAPAALRRLDACHAHLAGQRSAAHRCGRCGHWRWAPGTALHQPGQHNPGHESTVTSQQTNAKLSKRATGEKNQNARKACLRYREGGSYFAPAL